MNSLPQWQDFVNESGGVEGRHLKCAKGFWTADGCEVPTGPDGLKIVAVMPTAKCGYVKWDNQLITQRHIGFVEAGWTKPQPPDASFSPYISFVAVGAGDEGDVYFGELLTFMSSAWGGYRAFRDLLAAPYLRKGKSALPIATLETRSKPGDSNGNIDPSFKIIDWIDCAGYSQFMPASELLCAPPPQQLLKSRATAADIIDDDIPF